MLVDAIGRCGRSPWRIAARRVAAILLVRALSDEALAGQTLDASSESVRRPRSSGVATPDWKRLIVTDGPNQEAEREALIAALRLLPRLPARVAVIDVVDAKPDVQPVLLRLDTFIIVGSPAVYVVRHSQLLEGARKRSSIHIHALAAALWHEVAHLDGGDEREARHRERDLWTTLFATSASTLWPPCATSRRSPSDRTISSWQTRSSASRRGLPFLTEGRGITLTLPWTARRWIGSPSGRRPTGARS